jgi:magnesium transporter
VRIRLVTDAGVEELAATQVDAAVADARGLLWIDLDHTHEPGMAMLPRLFEVNPNDVADCYARNAVPRIHVYADHHFTAINGLARGPDDRLYFQPLKVFQNPRTVVTVLGPASSALPAEAARRELTAVHRRLDGGFRPRTSLELIAAIRRQMMDTLAELIADAAGRIGELERAVQRSDPIRSERMLDDLFAVRHQLQTIRTSAAQAYESYSNLLKSPATDGASLAVDVRRVSEMRQGFRHLVQLTDLEREYLQELLDLFQTRVATELNRFVRRITAWGTIGIGWTVVAGVYGMNFVQIPGLGAPWGFEAAIAGMLGMSAVLVVLFKRHGWL